MELKDVPMDVILKGPQATADYLIKNDAMPKTVSSRMRRLKLQIAELIQPNDPKGNLTNGEEMLAMIGACLGTAASIALMFHHGQRGAARDWLDEALDASFDDLDMKSKLTGMSTREVIEKEAAGKLTASQFSELLKEGVKKAAETDK